VPRFVTVARSAFRTASFADLRMWPALRLDSSPLRRGELHAIFAKYRHLNNMWSRAPDRDGSTDSGTNDAQESGTHPTVGGNP
jgi:hypothetical protein